MTPQELTENIRNIIVDYIIYNSVDGRKINEVYTFDDAYKLYSSLVVYIKNKYDMNIYSIELALYFSLYEILVTYYSDFIINFDIYTDGDIYLVGGKVDKMDYAYFIKLNEFPKDYDFFAGQESKDILTSNIVKYAFFDENTNIVNLSDLYYMIYEYFKVINVFTNDDADVVEKTLVDGNDIIEQLKNLNLADELYSEIQNILQTYKTELIVAFGIIFNVMYLDTIKYWQ